MINLIQDNGVITEQFLKTLVYFKGLIQISSIILKKFLSEVSPVLSKHFCQFLYNLRIKILGKACIIQLQTPFIINP